MKCQVLADQSILARLNSNLSWPPLGFQEVKSLDWISALFVLRYM